MNNNHCHTWVVGTSAPRYSRPLCVAGSEGGQLLRHWTGHIANKKLLAAPLCRRLAQYSACVHMMQVGIYMRKTKCCWLVGLSSGDVRRVDTSRRHVTSRDVSTRRDLHQSLPPPFASKFQFSDIARCGVARRRSSPPSR